MKQTILIALILAALVGVIAYGIGSKGLEVNGLGNIYTGTTTTFSSSTISTTPAVVLAQNTGAQFRSFSNITGVNAWWICNSTSTNFKAQTGTYIAPSSTVTLVEADGTMFCTDNIYAVTGGGTGKFSTQERN